MILNNILDCKFQLLLQMNSVQWQKKLTAFDDHLQVSFRFLSILTIFDTSDFVFITFLFWNNPPPLIIQRCVTARVRSDFAKDVKIMCLWVTPIWPNILKAHSWKVWLRLCAIFTLLYLNKENIKYAWACMYR